MYDFLIIGTGLFGATFARQLTDAGQRCLLIEKRPHIAGNCFTTQTAGITVHQYGPHFFHTNSRRIFGNRFVLILTCMLGPKGRCLGFRCQ